MNAEQKKIALECIRLWGSEDLSDCAGDQMAALLQELVDAPEPEPVAKVTGYYAGYLSIATVDGRVLPAGTALYAAPPHQSEHHLEMVNTPAPSVPDCWRGLTDVEWMNIVNFDRAYSSYDKEGAVNEAVKRTEAKLKELNAAQQQEPPADLVRDAERGPETLLLRQLQDLLADYGLFELLSAVRRVEQDETIRLQNAAIERDKLKGAK
jgi:hypothetical protein